MGKQINSDYLRGHIDTIILNALTSGEKYGYEICKDIETKSKGKFILKQPSLYSALKRLEKSGLINSYWQDSQIGGKRHYYTLTEEGIAHYEQSKQAWDYSANVLDALISDTDDDIKLKDENLNQDIADSKNKIEEVKSFYNQFPAPKDNDSSLQCGFFDSRAEEKDTIEIVDNKKQEIQKTIELVNTTIQNNDKNSIEISKDIELEAKQETENKDYSDKNDAVFINETYIPDENDPSYMNNIYLKTKTPIKQSTGAVNYVASDAIQAIDFYGLPIKNEKIQTNKIKEINPLDNYEIKAYSKHHSSVFKSDFIKYSKVKLYQYLLLFALMLIQISCCYFALKPTAGFTISTNRIYIISVIISMIFPIIGISLFSINPYRKKIINNKNSYIYRSILFCCAVLAIYGINVLCGMKSFLNFNNLSYWILPVVLSTNIIISELFFNLLKKSKLFKA